MPGEAMVLSANPHWLYFWKHLAAAVVVVVLAVLAWVLDAAWLSFVLWWVTAVALALLLVALAIVFVQWRGTHFAVTNRRVAYTTGVIHRRGVSIPLNRINNVNFTQTMIARMLNNGVVIIESAGETGDSVFENIPEPEKVRALIFKQVEVDEQRDSDRDAAALAKALRDQAPPATTGAAASVPERLKQLDDLRAQGLVTEAEYATKRQAIIEDL